MAWTTAAARSLFRIILGDGTTDKAEYKNEVIPTPDGLHTTFFVGRTRLVEASFAAVLDGTVLDASDWDLDPVGGILTIDPAPSATLLTSFNYQWFTDAELDGFLLDAATQLGFEGVDAESLPIALRSCLLDFASALAYTRKAGETAEVMQASSPDGYSINSKDSMNWGRLADAALSRAKVKFDFYLKSPFAFGKPSMSIVTFQLPRYTPNGY